MSRRHPPLQHADIQPKVLRQQYSKILRGIKARGGKLVEKKIESPMNIGAYKGIPYKSLQFATAKGPYFTMFVHKGSQSAMPNARAFQSLKTRDLNSIFGKIPK